MSRPGFSDCDHARVLAALAPDGELSELERRGLRSHLHGCDSCARFARGVERVSAVLRAEEPALPSVAVMPRVVHRRRALVARLRPVTAAAAVALMALGVASRAPLEMDAQEPSVRTTALAFGSEQEELGSLRAWRTDSLLQIGAAPLDRSASLGRDQPV